MSTKGELSARDRALLYLFKEAGDVGVSCFDVGEAVWPDRTSRIAPGRGGGDYAAQMLLGRMKKAGLVEHAPNIGSALWRLSPKGLEAVRTGLRAVLALRKVEGRA